MCTFTLLGLSALLVAGCGVTDKPIDDDGVSGDVDDTGDADADAESVALTG